MSNLTNSVQSTRSESQEDIARVKIALENCEDALERVGTLFAALWIIAKHASREDQPYVVRTLQEWKIISELANMGENEVQATLDLMPE